MKRAYKWQSAGMWVDQKYAIVQMPLVTPCGNSIVDKYPVETQLWINASESGSESGIS